MVVLIQCLVMFSALACETITIFGIGSNKAMDVINSSLDLAGNTVTIQADGKSDFLLGDFLQDMPRYGRRASVDRPVVPTTAAIALWRYVFLVAPAVEIGSLYYSPIALEPCSHHSTRGQAP